MPQPADPQSFKENIQEMFDKVSERYDLLNRILSFGRDLFWRKALARRLMFQEHPGSFLDLATGSGDQLLAIKKKWPYAELSGVDFSQAMLDLARKKFKKKPGPPPQLVLGDALAAPFADNSFDSVSISFGLRNILDRQALYAEALRLLKPGGRFLILELFFDWRNFLAPIHRFYLEYITPWMAERFFRSQAQAYRYLSDSVLKFPHPAVIADELETAGFKGPDYQTYTFDSAMLVYAHKVLR
jgi:demethylmenaquinone methyltransferase/2-methoxy-6-polyprenyl-1,4-benzoquinol methylase